MSLTDPSSISAVVSLDERQWLPRYCRGDAGAFDELVVAYQHRVYSYLVRCGVSEADRDDLFQDAFFKIHAAAANYEPVKALRPWLFTVVANTVRNHFRDEHKHHDHRAEVDVDQVQHSHSVEGVIRDRQAIACVETAITQLPLAQREVLILVAIEGLQQAEVSEVLEMPLNTVKTNLRRARMALATRLAAIERPR